MGFSPGGDVNEEVMGDKEEEEGGGCNEDFVEDERRE